MVTVQRSY